MIPVADLIPLIDWSYFYHAWKIKADNPEAARLRADADALLSRLAANPAMGVEAAQAFYPARPAGDVIEIDGPDGKVTIPTKRQAKSAEPDGTLLALCDFVAPASDHVGIFAATVSQAFTAELDAVKSGSDPYAALLMHTVGDRLVEAASAHPPPHRPWRHPSRRRLPLLPRPAQHLRPRPPHPLPGPRHHPHLHRRHVAPSSVTGLYISHPSARYFNT